MVFVFSKPVNVSKIMGNVIVQTIVQTSFSYVAVTTVWSSDNTSIKITPAIGKWEAGKAYQVTLPSVISAEASNEAISSDTYSVRITGVDLSKAQVNGLAYDSASSASIATFGLDSNAQSVSIKWNKLAGAATGYEIYAKKKDETAYTRIAIQQEINDTTLSITGSSISNGFYLLRDGVDSVSIIVAGKNNKGISLFSTPLVIKKTPATAKVTGLGLTEAQANFGITASATSINIKWNKLAGAHFYDIYAKRPDSTDYIFIFSRNDTNIFVSIDTYNIGRGIPWFSSADSANIVVVARSATGASIGDTIKLKAVAGTGVVQNVGLGNEVIQSTINTAISTSSITVPIKWNALAGANNYYIYKKGPGDTDYSSSPVAMSGGLTSSNIVITGVDFASGEIYYVKVTAINSSGIETPISLAVPYEIKKKSL
jgi:hypothetical protein